MSPLELWRSTDEGPAFSSNSETSCQPLFSLFKEHFEEEPKNFSSGLRFQGRLRATAACMKFLIPAKWLVLPPCFSSLSQMRNIHFENNLKCLCALLIWLSELRMSGCCPTPAALPQRINTTKWRSASLCQFYVLELKKTSKDWDSVIFLSEIEVFGNFQGKFSPSPRFAPRGGLFLRRLYSSRRQ